VAVNGDSVSSQMKRLVDGCWLGRPALRPATALARPRSIRSSPIPARISRTSICRSRARPRRRWIQRMSTTIPFPLWLLRGMPGLSGLTKIFLNTSEARRRFSTGKRGTTSKTPCCTCLFPFARKASVDPRSLILKPSKATPNATDVPCAPSKATAVGFMSPRQRTRSSASLRRPSTLTCERSDTALPGGRARPEASASHGAIGRDSGRTRRRNDDRPATGSPVAGRWSCP